MADPADILSERLRAGLATAFGLDPADVDPVVRPSTRDEADYQANGAMALAKQLGRPPREIAQAMLDQSDLSGVATAEIAGPGFVNLVVDTDFLAAGVTAVAGDARLGAPRTAQPETVVIDYSSPTVTKEMHVGHLRSTIIGDALVRLLEFAGHTVIRQNHIGDWGTPFGMLIEMLTDENDDSWRDDLNAFYQRANARYQSDEGFAERARARVVGLQSGDPESLARWQEFVNEALRHMQAVYDVLGVRLQEGDIRPESSFNPELSRVAQEIEDAGVAVVDDGALCVFIEGYDAPLMIRYSHGAYGYGTTDLAAVRHRVDDLGATRLLYVVDARQSQHLQQVFQAAERAGWLAPPARAEHVSFGSVLGRDGKPLKSRSGESPRLNHLLDEAVERAAEAVRAKNPDLDASTQAGVARMVGIGAVKYSDLANDLVKDYTFDFDRMLAFEGNTGPYLQYAHVRIRSIFRRAEVDPSTLGDVTAVVTEPQEKALALALLSFPAAVAAAADALRPHRLSTYLFDLASAFTSFFEACPVLRAPSDDIRASRLLLCDLTGRTLACGLDLLGIEAPDRM